MCHTQNACLPNVRIKTGRGYCYIGETSVWLEKTRSDVTLSGERIFLSRFLNDVIGKVREVKLPVKDKGRYWRIYRNADSGSSITELPQVFIYQVPSEHISNNFVECFFFSEMERMKIKLIPATHRLWCKILLTTWGEGLVLMFGRLSVVLPKQLLESEAKG